VNAWAERSCSNPCSNTADFADVRECSPVSKSLVSLRIRSLANCGEHAAEVWGSRAAGSNPVIPTGTRSRSEAVSEKSGAASFVSGGRNVATRVATAMPARGWSNGLPRRQPMLVNEYRRYVELVAACTKPHAAVKGPAPTHRPSQDRLEVVGRNRPPRDPDRLGHRRREPPRLHPARTDPASRRRPRTAPRCRDSAPGPRLRQCPNHAALPQPRGHRHRLRQEETLCQQETQGRGQAQEATHPRTALAR